MFSACEFGLGFCCGSWLNTTDTDNCSITDSGYFCSCNSSCVENGDCCNDFKDFCEWEGNMFFFLQLRR